MESTILSTLPMTRAIAPPTFWRCSCRRKWGRWLHRQQARTQCILPTSTKFWVTNTIEAKVIISIQAKAIMQARVIIITQTEVTM
mmetsp:Transcript_64158/g.88134  ORF Transcript_64158/g.88134 Transcript_64158/m.88134 type:complete len:85 (-) Transcript_64158:604-858(-)